MTKLHSALLVLALAAFLAPACNRRPLEELSEAVNIRIDINIRTVANITTDVYNEKIPVPSLNTDMMRVLVYDPVTKNMVSQSFISNKSYNDKGEQTFSGNLNIGAGTFDFLVYNFDTPATQVSGENNEETILAFTNPISADLQSKYPFRQGKGDDGEPGFTINYEPDHLIVAREEKITIAPHDTMVVIQTKAHTIIDTYYLQIHVEGMQYAAGATAVISGLSPSNHFGINQRTENPTVAVCFDLNKSTDDKLWGENKDVLCAVFNTFGKIEDADSELIVTFNVTDVAGNLLQFSFDLNTVFKTEDAIERHWLLINETIEIPNPNPHENPGTSASGFQPQVSDWEAQEGTILL